MNFGLIDSVGRVETRVSTRALLTKLGEFQVQLEFGYVDVVKNEAIHSL